MHYDQLSAIMVIAERTSTIAYLLDFPRFTKTREE